MNEWDTKPVMLGIHAWSGRPPIAGDFIKAPRGRTAYEVITFVATRPGSQTYGRVQCWRRRPADVPAGATVFSWQWGDRN